MPAKITLVNQVLAELGKGEVIQFDSNNLAMIIAARLDKLLPELLLACDWSFAVKYKEDDAPMTQNFSPEYVYTYQLPPDFGKFYRWPLGLIRSSPYLFLDELLLTNVRPVAYYYITNALIYEQLTPLASSALVYYCAAQTSPNATNNEGMTKRLYEQYNMQLARAIIEDRMRNPITSPPYNDYDRINFV